MTIKKCYFLILILLGAFSHAISSEKSITAPNISSGKWLATISIGGIVPPGMTFSLKKGLLKIFSERRGGEYKKSFQIDDKNPRRKAAITKEIVFQNIRNLSTRVQEYKKQNPNNPTMVLMGFTGHGTSDGHEFYYSLESGKLKSSDFVEMAKIINADEVIFIFQSCASGDLVEYGFEELSKKIKRDFKGRISVIVPSSKFLSTLPYVWERFLVESFSRNDIDRNKDHMISYGEWKNALLKEVCQYDSYIPKKAFLSSKVKIPVWKYGLDPYFFEKSVPHDLPILLTEEGLLKYNKGTLKMPKYSMKPAFLFEDTKAICEKEEKTFLFLHEAENQEIFEALDTFSYKEKLFLLNRMWKRDFKKNFPNERGPLNKVLFNIYREEKGEMRLSALINLKQTLFEEGQNKHSDQILSFLLGHYEGLSNILSPLKQRILEVLIGKKYGPAKDAFLSLLKEKDPELRKKGIEGLKQIEFPLLKTLLKEHLLEETDSNIKVEIYKYLIKNADNPFYFSIGQLKREKDGPSMALLMEKVWRNSSRGRSELVENYLKNNGNIFYHSNDNVRLHSALLVRTFLLAKYWKDMVHLLKNDSNSHVRSYASQALFGISKEKSLKYLLTSLEKDSHPSVKSDIAFSLRVLNNLELEIPFIKFSKSYPLKSRYVIEWLTRQKSILAKDVILSHLREGYHENLLLAAIIEYIKLFKLKEALPFLKRMLKERLYLLNHKNIQNALDILEG